MIDLNFLVPIQIGNKKRLGNLWDGGYVVHYPTVKRTCLLFSYGVGTDTAFEESFNKATKCSIYMFDPTIMGEKTYHIEHVFALLKSFNVVQSRIKLLEPGFKNLSVRRQCELLSVNRNKLYYKPVGESQENLKFMLIIDKHLMEHPAEGVLSVVNLLHQQGYQTNPKRIRRLFRMIVVGN